MLREAPPLLVRRGMDQKGFDVGDFQSSFSLTNPQELIHYPEGVSLPL
jgi:hypothetical protein